MVSVLFIFLIFSKDNRGNGKHQRVGDVEDLNYRGFNQEPKKEKYLSVDIMEKELEPISDEENTKRALLEAKTRIEQLEKKIAILEGRVPQKYPDVKFLGYKERKRILVSQFSSFF